MARPRRRRGGTATAGRGTDVVLSCSTTPWQPVGLDESDSSAISVGTAVLDVLVTFLPIAFVDEVGRRRLLVAGSTGMDLGARSSP